MSIPELLASLLGGTEAEAKQFFVSKSGKVPEDIPLNFRKKSLSDIFGKEPADPKEYRQSLESEYAKRIAENDKLPEAFQLSTGEILKNMNNELLQASLAKMGVNKLQDVVPKVLNAYGVSPEQQAKMNQMYILDPTKLKEGSSFETEGKTLPTILPKALGTGIGGVKATNKDLLQNIQDQNNQNVFGTPIKFKGPTDQVSPLSKVRTYLDTPKDSGVPEMSAAVMAHELIHSLNPIENTTREDYEQKLGKDVKLNDALTQTGFMGHFPSETLDNEPIYGMYGKVARMTHPEWFNKTKEIIKKEEE